MKSKNPALFISSDFPPVPGGQSNFLSGLWTHLPPEDVVILAPKYRGSDVVDSNLSCQIIRKRWPLGNNFFSKIIKAFFILLYARRVNSKFKFKKIHCGQLISAGFSGLILKKILNIPYIIYVYGADLLEYEKKSFLRKILMKIILKADRIIVISQFTKLKVLETGVSPEKVRIINPGIDLEDFEMEFDVQDFKSSLHLEGKKIVLTVARLVERKGHDLVLEAMPQIIRDIPDAHYLILGKGPFKKNLEKMTVEKKLQDYVSFLGFVPDSEIPKYYSVCDVFVMVSREIKRRGDVEGFGIVFLEANALKKPIIAGRSGGIEDAVEDGVTGLLVDPEDVDEIAGSIIQLLKDENLRNRLGQQGYTRVKERYDWKNRQDDLRLLLDV